VPEGPPVVVAAAILERRGGHLRLLAAQRAAPPALAGRWEFPGGKVEPGESERDALVRECREELGVEILVAGRLGADLPSADGRAVLRVWTASVRAGAPRAVEHLAIRWLTAAELYDVDWLPQDLALVEVLRGLLRA
jgi:8-oxo-dGTP diphosphatase